MTQAEKSRLKRVTLYVTLFFMAGILYAMAISIIGRGIPCIFHLVTGIACPGCGMTHAMMAIFHGNFYEALRYNLFVYLYIIYILMVIRETSRHYIKTGKMHLSSGFPVCDLGLLILLIPWTILRNIFDVSSFF